MMKKIMKYAVIGAAALAIVGCGSKEEKVVPSADTISSASTAYYYEKSSIKGDSQEFIDIMKNPSKFGAVTVSTTNEDGSPNVAVIIPGLVDEENQYLLMTFGTEGSTYKNLKERKLGIVTVFQQNPDAEDKAQRNLGMRVIVEAVENQDKALDDLISAGKLKQENKAQAIVLQIKKVIPLG